MPASKAALEKSAAASRESGSRYVPEAERNGRTPAEAVAENQFVTLAGQLFGLGSALNLQ